MSGSVYGWTIRVIASCALAVPLAAPIAYAATLEQDEARIEALLRAEHVASEKAAAAAALDASANTPVIAEVVAVPPVQSAKDDWIAAPPKHDRSMSFTELSHCIGCRVSIVTAGDREHRGVVGSVDGRQVTLKVRRAGGNASYTLLRNQIVRIDER